MTASNQDDRPLAQRPTSAGYGADRHIAALIFIASFIYLYLLRRYTNMEPDEGIILQGAERILHGQTPYRDFFSFYTPGSYYLTAATLRFLGDSLATARTVLAAGASVMSALAYLLARRVCSRGVASGVAALTTLTALPYRYLVLHNWDSTLWAVLALYVAVRYVEAEGGPRAFALGSLAAFTVLCEQSKGAGLALGLAMGFTVLAIARRRCSAGVATGGEFGFESASEGTAVKTPPLQHLLVMAAGFGWPFLVVFAWFAHQHAVTPMIQDWVWPFHHYSRANSVPYGYQNWSEASRETLFGSPNWGHRLLALLVVAPCFLVPMLPLGAAATFAWLSYRAIFDPAGWRAGGSRSSAMESQPLPPLRREGHDDLASRDYYVLVSGVITGLLLSVLAGRADILHFMYLAPILYLVLAWILDGRDVSSPLFGALQPALRVLVIICFALLAAALGLPKIASGFSIQTRRGTIKTSAPDQVLAELASEASAGSTVVVYPYLPLYYYLTATFAPGAYDYFQPGMHTPEQAAELKHSLAENHPGVVLYEYRFDEKIPSSWPNTPLEAIASDPVADFLLAHYHPCTVLTSAPGWRFLFMVPMEKACPAGTF